jgi:ABC-2 type transport system ATP-binding protein
MLSAGEMARLLLTKAFINYPKIILLDEPTASLDPDIAVKIREFLRRQQREYKVSMLFTSHNMSEVEEMCDNIVFLNKGKIIAKDKPENLSKQIPESEVEFITKNILKAKNFLESQKISFVQNKNTFKISLKTKNISKFITSMTSEKIEYEDISINKPNLEDYFLKMSKRSNL